MKKTIQTLRQMHIILRACFLMVLPAIAGSHAAAQSSGTTIDLSVTSPPSGGTGWSYYNHVYTIRNGANVTVKGNDASNYMRIEIDANATATLTLNGATINDPGSKYDRGAIMLNGNSRLTLNLVGTNSVTGPRFRPAISVRTNNTNQEYLTIQGDGSLTARGGSYAAGIGGGDETNAGTINIYSGTITATGVYYAAGIGGGDGGNGGTVNISGGTVIAKGGVQGGAGIGGGYSGNGGTINISGGTVEATGGDFAAGLGGGGNGKENNGNVIITGGSVKRSNNIPQAKNGNGRDVYLNTLTIGSSGDNISVTAGSIGGKSCSETANASAGVYGIKDVKTRDGSKVYFYLPNSGEEWVKLTAGGAGYGKRYSRSGSSSQTLDNLPYDITLSQTGNHSFGSATYGYNAPTALTVTVINSGSNPTGELNITLSGGDQSAFTASTPIPSIDASGSTGSFTVTPETELAAGTTYMETVTVSGGNGITASFPVSFTVNKKTITVSGATIAPKTYDGKTNATVTGITFSENINLDGNYTVSNAAFTDPNAGNSNRTVKMNVILSTDPSSPAKNYTLSGGTGWQLANQTISKANLTKAHLDFDLTEADADYDGFSHGIADPTLKTNPIHYEGLGAVTVYYTSTDGGVSYAKSETAPVNMGAYTVTVDVIGSANFNDISGLPLGTFTIGKITLTASHLDYALNDATYDGRPHGIAAPTLKSAYTGMGTILKVYYTSTDGTTWPKSATAPVNAGEYDVTVDVSEGSIFKAASDLWLGSYIIAPATPTVAVLDFTLRDGIYDDRLHPVTVTPATGIEGLGAITVYYNGSTTPPVYPGEYAVTIDIAAGTNYTGLTGLPLGTFSIYKAPTPVIRRRVTLLPTPGLTTDPPADTYYINSGSNFTFRLTPDVPSPDGAPPQVHTNRAPATDGSTGIRMTANTDGSYTVVLLAIRQDIEISLSTATDNNSVSAGALTLGTAPGAIVIANSRPDAATVYVYNLAGTLVRLTTVPPGTTRLSVTPGIYIVTDGGAFRRKAAVAR